MADTTQVDSSAVGISDDIANAAREEIDKVMGMALQGVVTVPQNEPETGQEQETEKMAEDTTRVVREEVVYMEPIPDPYGKAIKYLEQHNILQLFQSLTTNIVYRKPADPLAYMMKEVKKLKKEQGKK